MTPDRASAGLAVLAILAGLYVATLIWDFAHLDSPRMQAWRLIRRAWRNRARW